MIPKFDRVFSRLAIVTVLSLGLSGCGSGNPVKEGVPAGADVSQYKPPLSSPNMGIEAKGKPADVAKKVMGASGAPAEPGSPASAVPGIPGRK